MRAYIDEFIDRPITMIFGAMKDKDIAGIATALFTKADKLILTQPENPRALLPTELESFVKERSEIENVFTSRPVKRALQLAREVTPDNGVIVVTGSLYLVGEVKRILQNE